YEIEKASGHKFVKIVVNTDNAVVATILRTKRVSAIPKRENCPVLRKYLMLLQELFPVSEWVRLDIQLVSTDHNEADRLTRHPFLTKLITYRSKLGDDKLLENEETGYVHLASVQDHCCSTCVPVASTKIPTKLTIPIDLISEAQRRDGDLRIVKSALTKAKVIPRI
ncbi:hypothetical protein FOZ62_020793, partial [Perkinsus olseni]